MSYESIEFIHETRICLSRTHIETYDFVNQSSVVNRDINFGPVSKHLNGLTLILTSQNYVIKCIFALASAFLTL